MRERKLSSTEVSKSHDQSDFKVNFGPVDPENEQEALDDDWDCRGS